MVPAAQLASSLLTVLLSLIAAVLFLRAWLTGRRLREEERHLLEMRDRGDALLREMDADRSRYREALARLADLRCPACGERILPSLTPPTGPPA